MINIVIDLIMIFKMLIDNIDLIKCNVKLMLLIF
jgi:hypothetical protein